METKEHACKQPMNPRKKIKRKSKINLKQRREMQHKKCKGGIKISVKREFMMTNVYIRKEE
jgi:hypothetical protein